jgi:hypothetical protein
MNIIARLIKLANDLDAQGNTETAENVDKITTEMINKGEESHSNFQVENWTPHPVTLILTDGSKITLEPKTSTPPRVIQKKEEDIPGPHGMPIILRNTSGAVVERLPEERPGIFLLVSSIVASAAAERSDLLVPNDFVRDEEGNIVGCKSFAKYI